MNLLKNIIAPSDEQIMWRVRSNDDPEAFAQLVNKWQGSIQRLCVRMLGDSHRGEDLAQEAFARLYAKRADYQPAARFSTYLWRVALNLCYDELRRLKRRPETSLDIDQSDSDETFSILDAHAANETTPESEIQNRERAEIVREAPSPSPRRRAVDDRILGRPIPPVPRGDGPDNGPAHAARRRWQIGRRRARPRPGCRRAETPCFRRPDRETRTGAMPSDLR